MARENDDELAALFVAALEGDSPRSKKSRPPPPPDARGHTLPGALDRSSRKTGNLEPLPPALARAPTAAHPDLDGSEEPTPPPQPRRTVLSSIAPARIAVQRDDPGRRSVPPPPPEDDRKGAPRTGKVGTRASVPAEPKSGKPTTKSIPVGEMGKEGSRASKPAPRAFDPEGSRASKPPTRAGDPEGSRASKPPTRAGDPEGSRASKPPTRASKPPTRPTPTADLTREPEPSRAKKLPRGKPADALLEEISRSAPMPELTPSVGMMTPTGNGVVRGTKVRASSAVPLGPDGEPLIDHRGRSRPLYKPRRVRPEATKLPRALDLVLGVFPGARLLAHHQVSAGMLYAFLGIASLVPLVAVLIGWSDTLQSITDLSLDPQWLGLHAAIGFFSLFAFELLRVGSSSPKGRPTLTRTLAALFVPSLAMLAWAPALGVEVHKALEISWLLAMPCFFVGLTASLWCTLPIEGPRRKVFVLWEIATVLVLIAAFAVLAVQNDEVIATVASALRSTGFRMVPEVLARFANS